MRALSTHFLSTTMALAVPLALAPLALSAQEPTQEAPQCIATVEPLEIQAGQAAVQIKATLSEDIGPVSEFTGPEDSGLTLADPADIPRVDMANPEEEPSPIVMTPETNSVTLWLTTAEVTPGEFEVRLQSEQSYCTAQVAVIETPGL